MNGIHESSESIKNNSNPDCKKVEVQTLMKAPLPKVMIFNIDWLKSFGADANEVSNKDLLMVYMLLNQSFEVGQLCELENKDQAT